MDRYQVIDDIGGGGMGRVRLAQTAEGRLVVLKTAIHDEDDERLRDEARVGMRLNHGGIVETIELLEVADRQGRKRPVLVTGYVPGISLVGLRKVGALPPAMVCRLGKELSLALGALHAATGDDGRPLGIIHRDVTAGNCLVGYDGRARLIDLGIARSLESQALRTETGLLRGTLRYLAPELFDGGRYSAQTDLWSLGVALWEALLGRPAVVGSDAVAIHRVCDGLIMVCEDYENPEPTTTKAIRHLLERDPRLRPATANEAAVLFSQAERALSSGDDAVVDGIIDQTLKGTLSAEGDDDDDDRGRIVRQASRSFQRESRVETGPVLAPMPTTMPWVGGTTDADDEAAISLRRYAARLAVMEQAHARAWQAQVSAEAALRSRGLMGSTTPTSDGATVLLDLPPRFSSDELTDMDVINSPTPPVPDVSMLAMFDDDDSDR